MKTQVYRSLAGAVALAAAGLTFSACGSATSTDGPRDSDDAKATLPAAGTSQVCSPIEVGALRMAGIADYGARTPLQLMTQVDAVVAATLTEISEGYTTKVDGDAIPYLVATFRVSTKYTDHAELVHGGSIYLRLDQGPIEVESGEPSFELDDFQRALPVGTETVLFLNDVSDEIGTAQIEVLPAGAQLAGAPMDGVLLDDCGTLVGGKDDLHDSWAALKTLDDLKAVLARG